ncbi:MAG: D-glycero-beta-D-manno-heptose-7-phosphate kinase [Rhodospirillaceae bacterium]|nr:D-glycero-beta-D-manno-heptose-7-phosphate kinase [Rhodospirillaceae bacterium]
MLDRYIHGDMERISPEAPVPVLRIAHSREVLGGAGNVARNIMGLGGTATLAGMAGDDDAGATLERLCREALGGGTRLTRVAGATTTVKTRLIARHQQVLRLDAEQVAPLDAATQERLLDDLAPALAAARVVVLSDYAKGFLGDAMAARLIAAARAAGKPVIVDPKGADFAGRYRGATVLTPNLGELRVAAGLPVDDDEAVVAACRRLIESCDTEAVVATRSEAGMTVVERSGTVAHLPAQALEVFDVSGAGDTVVATLALGLGAGVPLVDAARLANAAAGIVVGKVGTATVSQAELLHALHGAATARDEEKVQPLAQAVDQVATWRRRGRTVGFTNGCFDLLHPGHVSLLRQARAACDKLVLGLNSDASVARLKGPGRPVQPEAARAAVLAALGTVDLVVIFAEDTPERVIEALRPDVLVKGADYTVDTVVGAGFVQSYGGRVVLADLAPGHSTTSTVARLRGDS